MESLICRRTSLKLIISLIITTRSRPNTRMKMSLARIRVRMRTLVWRKEEGRRWTRIISFSLTGKWVTQDPWSSLNTRLSSWTNRRKWKSIQGMIRLSRKGLKWTDRVSLLMTNLIWCPPISWASSPKAMLLELKFHKGPATASTAAGKNQLTISILHRVRCMIVRCMNRRSRWTRSDGEGLTEQGERCGRDN